MDLVELRRFQETLVQFPLIFAQRPAKEVHHYVELTALFQKPCRGAVVVWARARVG